MRSTRALIMPMTAPAIVLPIIIDVDDTGAASIQSNTPMDLSHTMLIVSLMLPNMAVIPTMPDMRNCMKLESGAAVPYLKLNVNIINIGNRRLQTTWRTDLNDWRRSFSAIQTECNNGVNGFISALSWTFLF